ncbi:hypothetical protein [Mycobacterium avium]|uniref:Uncharacterized protein n=1 Tax=Mycobacterium avium (strain 104) TaxID=243243 RepID=A0A0H2ZXA4_MYCA1|nr:hypothetical protein [Mycobacterium avium]ABK67270.1 conserved hypothetical protein [Mycobacterium avium 104]KDP09314.1 hypothetical protein MAV101_01460 [Mycobacterium avium subsp. hominissuis 101]MCG3242997.1 hypothetical protein [Mycobacterium avium subsp. hominissuis]
MAQFGGLASPIPDPTPQPHGAASTTDIPVRGTPDAADTKPEPATESKPDAEEKRRPNRDGKTPADPKPVPDAGEKPDTDEKPKPDVDKAEPKAKVKDIGQVTANDKVSTIGKSFGKAYLEAAKSPIKGIPAIVKAEYKAGTALGEKLAGKIAGEGLLKSASRVSLKTAGRLVPGVGTAIGVISAYKNFEQGDYVGAAINMVSAIPGPIGWVGIAASTAWEAFDLGGNKIGQWDSPDGSTTHILPAAAHDIGGVTALDSQLREAQQCVFSFQDGPRGKVWDSNPPEALRLDGADIQKEIAEALGGISDLFAEVDRVMSSAGEAYFDEYKARLQPHLEAMAALKEQVKPFTQQLGNASDGAATAYTAVLDANRAAREQLVADGKLSDQGPASTFTSAVSAAGSQVTAADQNIANLFGEPAAVLTATVASGTGTRIDPSKKGAPVQTTASPAAQTPVTPTSQTPTVTPKTETPAKTTDALGDLLRSLNQKQQMPTTPSTPNLGNGLGSGSPLGTGGSPLSTSPSKPLDTSSDRKLDDGRKGEEKKEERKLAEPKKEKSETKPSLAASKTDNAKAPESKLATAEKPGAHTAAVPAQPSAAAAAANPAAPAAQGQSAPPEQSKQVDVKGTRVEFPDAKTAKLASLLANADPAHPLSLAEAAKMAGLTPPVPGQDPGSQVAPAQAKPGDLLVAGDKKYMLLEPGKFYDLQEYKVVSADQLPQDAGSRGGYFHLNDPSPTGAPGTQPVSGQTPGGVDQAVPGGTPPPAAPADATPQKPHDPAAGAPAPSGGVPSAGTPGAPKPTATGGGPSSAEATQTGVGQPSPSPSTSALDPTAVR